MRLEAIACLDDLIRAGDLIKIALAGITQEQFLANWEKQSAVERQFMIIGEAMLRIRHLEPEVFERIPEARKIVSFRNLLAHGYDVADPEAIYDVAGEPLSELTRIASEILAESPHA
jgi:uncharacterized protein with HEPN domain